MAKVRHVGAASTTPVLRVGSQGKAVRTLEKKLKARGLFNGKVDDVFDARTRRAVKRYEASKNWKADGVVGDRIWRSLGVEGADAFSFKTVSINVKNNPLMPQKKVVHDVRRAARQGGLIGWNEIGPGRYRRAIRNLGSEWGHYFPKDKNLNIPNPISWKKSVWKKVGSGFQRTHNGLAKVSPHRYVTWVKLKHRATGKTVVRLNTHLVSGAWSKKKANRPTTPWRRHQWNVHMDKLRALVARFKKQGHMVIVGGDFNRDSYRVLGKQVVYDNKLHVGTHGGSTLDYVMHVRDDDLKRTGRRVVGDFRSDHDAVVVRYKVKK